MFQRFAGFVLGGAVVLAISAGAQAQSRPYNASDPFASDVERGGTNQSYPEVYDYPATEVRAVVGARVAAAEARTRMHFAQRDLNRSLRDAQYEFKNSDEMRDALNAEQQAYEDLMAARTEAIRPLQDDVNYVAQVKLRDDMGKALEQARAAERPDEQHISTLAHLRMMHASTVSEMEAARVNSSTSVQDARRRLQLAGARVSELRHKFSRDVRTDADLVAARDLYNGSRLNHIVAQAYLTGAVEARNIAMNFAYFLHGYDYRRPYYYPYAYTSYGDYGGAYTNGDWFRY